MYRLTLTYSERRAIDWIGYRYSGNDELGKQLIRSEWDGEWDSYEDITFSLTREACVKIIDAAKEDDPPYSWPCFADHFVIKLYRFFSQFEEYWD